MKQTKNNRRTGARVAMYALAFVAAVGLLAVPEDDNPAWMASLVLSKVVAFGAGWGSYRLWSDLDEREP